MKYKRLLFIIVLIEILITLFFTPSHAWIVRLPKKTYDFGIRMGSFYYEEPSVMKEHGFIYGAFGSFSYYSSSNLMFNIGLEGSSADLDYDGGIIDLETDKITHFIKKSNTDIFEVRTLIGYNLAMDEEHITMPFAGIGYRYWNDKGKSIYSYEREIRYLYLPLGYKCIRQFSNGWQWGFSAEYDLFLKGEVCSHFSDVDLAYNDPEVAQHFGNGFGLRLSFIICYLLKERFRLSIEPYLIYWNVEDSERGILTHYGLSYRKIFEPKNETRCFGLAFSFGF